MEEIVRLYAHESVDSLLVKPNEHKTKLVKALKCLFDTSVKLSEKRFGPLDELVTGGLDHETVWEEIQTRNRPIIRFLKNRTVKLLSSVEEMEALEASALNSEAETSDEGEHEDSDGIDDEDEDEGEVEDSEVEEEKDESDEEDADYSNQFSEDSEDDSGMDEGDEEEASLQGEVASANYDEEEDEMEAFLDRTDALEEKYNQRLEQLERKAKGHKGMLELAEDEDEDDEEDGVDDILGVQSALYDSEDEDDDEGGDDYDDEDGGDRHGGVKDIKYEDFFGPKPAKKSKSSLKGGKIVKFAAADDDDESDAEDFDENGHDDYDDYDEEDYDQSSKETKVALTTHSKHSAKIGEQISALESDLIGPKSWDLRGEVKGSDRPENSLLGIVAEVDRSSKPAPIITQAYTNTIEEMIKKRIKDENFDDVVPPTMAAMGVRSGGADDVELSQEKSKEGLGELYAQEFLKKTMEFTQGNAQLDTKRAEARDLFDTVCRNLDALSHFFYQPRPVSQEAKITAMKTGSEGRVSSISLEDIAPVTESMSTATAPEELFGKKHGREGMLQSTEEMTSDDRQRIRRANKASKRKDKKMQEAEQKLVARLNPGMGNKYEKQKTLDFIRNDKRVTIVGSGGEISGGKKNKGSSASNSEISGGGKGSTSLFKQLQDEARLTIDQNRSDNKNKRQKTK